MSIFSSKPQRFFRAFSISGKPADLGFQCETCHSVIRYGLLAGQTVEHCGQREEVPSSVFGMQCRSLKRGMPEMSSGFILVDTDCTSDGIGWDEENAAKSDDPSAYEVPWV